MQIQYSAPGKVIISGEHSVVYGKKALVSCIELRTSCLIQEVDQCKKSIQIIQSNSTVDIDFTKLSCKIELTQLFQNLQNNYSDFRLLITYFILYIFDDQKFDINLLDSSIQICITSNVPLSRGLGSSASFSASFAASLIHYLQIKQNKQCDFNQIFIEKINQIAYHFEHIFHGQPSGIDNNVIIHGSQIVYQKNQKIVHLQLQLIDDYEIFLIDSGIPKCTSKCVAQVRQNLESQELGVLTKQLLDNIGLITESMIDMIQKEQVVNFENLINQNQNLLENLDLSSPQIDQIINICKQFFIPSKITGGGKGGMILTFIKKNSQIKQEFLKQLESNQFQYFQTTFEKNGLKREQP